MTLRLECGRQALVMATILGSIRTGKRDHGRSVVMLSLSPCFSILLSTRPNSSWLSNLLISNFICVTLIGTSTWNDDGYYLTGILFGLALYNGVLLDVHFPQAVYRKLLGLPLGLEDLVDEEVRKGLQQLLDYDGDDVESIFCLNWQVTWVDLCGIQRTRELKRGGSNIPVTSENKEEYTLAYVKWILVDSIAQQYDEFERGFLAVTAPEKASPTRSRFCGTLDLLRPHELELLVVGSRELDFAALEKATKYEGGYDGDSAVVRNLWRFIKSADPEEQLRFLKFTTGSIKAPIGGLGNLSFLVQRAGPDSMQLPTCKCRSNRCCWI